MHSKVLNSLRISWCHKFKCHNELEWNHTSTWLLCSQLCTPQVGFPLGRRQVGQAGPFASTLLETVTNQLRGEVQQRLRLQAAKAVQSRPGLGRAEASQKTEQKIRTEYWAFLKNGHCTCCLPSELAISQSKVLSKSWPEYLGWDRLLSPNRLDALYSPSPRGGWRSPDCAPLDSAVRRIFLGYNHSCCAEEILKIANPKGHMYFSMNGLCPIWYDESRKKIKLQWLTPLSLPNFERVVLCGDGGRLVQASIDGYTDLRRIIRKRIPRFTD